MVLDRTASEDERLAGVNWTYGRVLRMLPIAGDRTSADWFARVLLPYALRDRVCLDCL